LRYSAHDSVNFNPSASQVDFTPWQTFDIRNVFAIVDITAAAPIYLMGVTNYGYSAIDPTGRILTLQASMSGLASTDKLAVSYDEGTDNLDRLLSLASGFPDLTRSTRDYPSGLLVRGARIEELLALNFAAIRVLTRMTIADKQVNDSDIDSMLSDELSSSNWL
jgi:hypothetical protein